MRLDIKKSFVGVLAGILFATMVACTPAATDNADITEEETTEMTIVETTEVTFVGPTEISSEVEEDTTEADTSTSISEEPTIIDVEETTVTE